MKKQKVFMLWDEQNKYRTSRVYLDRPSAEIALSENYTAYWIEHGMAKIEEVEAVSYLDIEETK